MRRKSAIVAVSLFLAAAGCGHLRSQSVSTAPPKPPAPDLPVANRSVIQVDISGLPREPSGKPPSRPAEYRKLTAAECRSFAIKQTPFADELDSHPENQPSGHPWLHPFRPKPSDAEAGRRVRGYLADELRNRAAADALDKYFQLAQAEGQFDLLVKSMGELRARLADAEDAERRGLSNRATVDGLRVQVLDLEAKIAELDAGIDSLNAALRAHLGIDPADTHSLWPDDPLRIRPEDVDIVSAVKTGLLYRPDLNLLRTLLADDGRAVDEIAQALLKQVSPLMAKLKSNPLVGALAERRESVNQEATRRQLQSMLDGRERQAEAEIRAAALTLRGHRLAAIAKAAEVRRQAATLVEVEKRAAAGQPVAAELTKAKLDLWKAQGELLKSAVEWQRADVKLRQAMGLLVRE